MPGNGFRRNYGEPAAEDEKRTKSKKIACSSIGQKENGSQRWNREDWYERGRQQEAKTRNKTSEKGNKEEEYQSSTTIPKSIRCQASQKCHPNRTYECLRIVETFKEDAKPCGPTQGSKTSASWNNKWVAEVPLQNRNQIRHTKTRFKEKVSDFHPKAKSQNDKI